MRLASSAIVSVLCTVTALAPARIHLVVNPFGGGGAGLATLDAVRPIFEAAGMEVNTLMTEYAGHAGEYVSSLDLPDGVVGIGGDGTAHELADAMLRRPEDERVPIGIVPAGSGNTWAFDLGVGDATVAARAVAAGQTSRVDVRAVESEGDAAVRYAINICGVGMPAAVLERANALRAVTGGANYELAGLTLIAAGQTSYGATLEVETADGAITLELEDFSFAQAQVNRHMGKRVCFAPDALMDDGLLNLVLIKKSGALDILHANALARSAMHVDLPFVEVIGCRSYTLTPRRAPPGLQASTVNLDGELEDLGSGGAFRARCVPRALEVFSPRLNDARVDTSDELEPRLVMGLVGLLGG